MQLILYFILKKSNYTIPDFDKELANFYFSLFKIINSYVVKLCFIIHKWNIIKFASSIKQIKAINKNKEQMQIDINS